MLNNFSFENYIKKLQVWAKVHYPQLALFNILLVFLVLLRSAGYFHPFFPITINLIVFLSIIFSIVLLNFGSRQVFLVALIFWLIAAFFRMSGVEVWAERSAFYSFQSLLLGTLLLIIESLTKKSYDS